MLIQTGTLHFIKKNKHYDITPYSQILRVFTDFNKKVNEIIASLQIKSNTPTEIIIDLLNHKAKEKNNNYFFAKYFQNKCN